jgi:RimJ/RimL family protein N-acetyltransferase
VSAVAVEAALDHWPLFGLRLRTPRLELRPVRDDDLPLLIEVARGGIHSPEAMPFGSAWTDYPPAEFGRRFAQYFWRQRAGFSADSWQVGFLVTFEGEPVGVQQLAADSFPILRTVGSGSWLARSAQGRGIGTEMRAAVLHLAFAELGADAAVSGAYSFNGPSLGVSRKLGYIANGIRHDVVGGRAVEAQLLRLTREQWRLRLRPAVEVEGFAACRKLFGV